MHAMMTRRCEKSGKSSGFDFNYRAGILMKTRAHKVVAKNKERRAHREQASGADVGVSVSVVRTVSLAPLAHAVALIIATGAWHSAHAQQAFSSAWFAAKGAAQSTAASTGYLPNGMPASSLTNPALQQQKANQQLQTSLNNLSIVARGIAAQQAAQQAARLAALNGNGVPDGLGDGGLKVDTNSLTKGWLNANAPTQTTAGGQTTVAIQQTADRAILNWESFNVGKNTLLRFYQDANWAVLNRVNDPLARPSQIQGQIKGDGTVMIVNRNGIIFSGSSRVNTRSLVASTAGITDAQFRDKGLYVDATGTQPSFTNAMGKIEVQAGAQLSTSASTSATQSGGYVLLMGSEVNNAGQINTPGGQVTLAAGDNFYIRKGASTDGNATSTTRGNEVSAQLNVGSASSGKASNTGLITAATGDITMTGHAVVQAGVVVSTTSVSTRGTIHLLNRASDTAGSVTLAEGSTTALLLDQSASTALDSQRDAALKNLDGVKTTNNITANFDNLSNVSDRGDLSRIEIVSGNTVEFKDASTTLATGGQIAVSAKQRSLVGNGAILNVAGAVGVSVAMESNNLSINVQGNELRDASGNRDGGLLNSSNVWIDRRSLVLVPAGTNGYTTDRWYTAGGLLEVSGYLATGGHSVGEWMALGGSVTFSGKDVVTQARSNINLSGGTLNVQTGYLNQSWLKGADGQLYEVSKAPRDLLYNGLYKGYELEHARWGKNATEYFYNPLIGPQRRLESGYTVGRDAGRLIIATDSAVLEGQLTTEVFQGGRQTQAAQAGLDGYYQSQNAAAQRGQLIIGQYLPRYDTAASLLRYGLTPKASQVTLADQVAAIADGLGLSTALPADRLGSVLLDSGSINGFGLGGLIIGGKDSISVNSAVQMANGGNITLYAPQVSVNADIAAHGGSINLGNVLLQMSANNRYEDTNQLAAAGKPTVVNVADGVKLDASGMWSNLQKNQEDIGGLPAMNGGTVSIRSTRDVLLGRSSLIDVSSGAAMLASGKSSGGKGGSVRLQNNAVPGVGTAMRLDGDLRGYGVAGGGTLTIDTGSIVIGGSNAVAGGLQLAADYFSKGFSSYALAGLDGITVADGAQLNVFMPVYRIGADAGSKLSGRSADAALEVWTPPVYQEDPVKAKLTQRKGASISLQAGTADSTLAASRLNTTVLRIGRDANINVDPGQTVTLSGIGQITIDRGARLNAWGGNITLGQLAFAETNPTLNAAYLTADKHSIWIGEQVVLDVAARAVTAVDMRGRTYGVVGAGGSIVIGGTVDPAKGLVSTQNLHVFVAVREGAVLDASGSQATLDIDGLGKTVIAGNGGSIALAAGDGLYLDGIMRAASGGSGAAGGSLSVAQDLPSYLNTASVTLQTPRQFIIDQQAQPSALTAGLNDRDGTAQMVYGHARLGVDQVQNGGFGQLTLFGRGGIFFNGNIELSMSQSLQLYAGGFSQLDAAHGATRVNLAAPYVRLAGAGLLTTPDQMSLPTVSPVVLPATPASLNANAALIDMRDTVTLGFSTNTFNSSGDLRLLASVNAPPSGAQFSTIVSTAGDITLRAAQIYPDTGAMASVQAGVGWGKEPATGYSLYNPASILRVERNGSDLPALPYSVFGVLQLGAATVEQGGVLRAPLGAIKLGNGDRGFNNQLDLLPGSLTSVSAAGLIMPYGGTVDGISYTYGGNNVTLVGIGGNPATQGVSLAGTSVNVQAGAVIDLSGGGNLTGAGFVSGRGGSTDVRTSPLMQVGTDGRFSLPTLASNPVYAIVPGQQVAQAPGVSSGAATDPLIGQKITIGQGVPGLPAGTYTLMPSTYALLPGAFRVELNGAAGLGASFATMALRNGSSTVAAQLSMGNTGIADTLFRQAIVTPAKTMRTYSQYNEMSYAQFIAADAARRGITRAMEPDDGKSLMLTLRTGGGADAFQFDGSANFGAVNDGYDGSLVVVALAKAFQPRALEIVAPGADASPGFNGVTLHSDSLNKLLPGRMMIGSTPSVLYGQGGNVIGFSTNDTAQISLRSGASLSAPEVMLVTGLGTNSGGQNIVIEQGAAINTIGKGKVSYDATNGFVYSGGVDMLAVSNGLLNFIPNTVAATGGSTDGIRIGGCTFTPCIGATELYSEGSIAAFTSNSFSLDDTVRYGTRNLTLGVSSVNAGTPQALADAAARNALPFGFALNQNVLNRLLAGDTRYGAPALETLILTARDSFNFYGSTSLSTLNAATGKSSLKNLVLNTPAIYGYGNAGDVATIQTGNLIGNGGTSPAGNIVAQGAGTGSGTLDIRAERIEFGYAPFTQPSSLTVVDRLTLGFANVNFTATDRITANHKGGLSVYQSQGAYDAATGYQYSGGNLNITTPLLTGEAASVNRITAGGTITVAAPAGIGAAAAERTDVALGAELSLTAGDVRLDSTVALASGKLSITSAGDLLLDKHATIDMAGRKLAFFDINKYSWGGDVTLESRSGNLRQAAGSLIDLSAQNNRAGTLKATALADAAGVVDLQGSILGTSSGYYDAGGTLVPYLAATIDIGAQNLGDSGALDSQFAALNQRLTAGGVFGGRSFQLKQGDLNIGSDIKAGEVNVSVDNGSLTVYGTIDASGERVGSIRLAAGNNLTISGGALLDAHGSTLRVDSYGKIIDSPNRAIVELSSGDTGQLTLASGSRIDLRHGTDAVVGLQAGQNDGVARGTLTLNAFRTGETSGDIRIDAGGNLNIAGARSIAVNAMWRYIDAPDGVDPLVTRPFQVITQGYLDQKHTQNTLFMTAALANGNLMNSKLTGLRAYNDAFHLRPGMEIASKTADGDLVVQGDLDLSGYRYASVNPHTQLTGVYGSGEAGALTLRAGGNLDVYGSINDGFAPPPATPDDNGWLLLPGKDFTGGNIIIPRSGVVLDDGTIYEAGQTLNYDLPIQARAFETGQLIPVASTLSAPMTLAAGTVLSTNVRDASGNLLRAAGSVLAASETLPANTRFDAGMRLPGAASLTAMIWPKNVKLPELSGGGGVFVMNGATTLPMGAFIPAGTDIKLPGGVASIDLRDRSSGSQGKLWAIAAMLPEGSQSWAMRLVAGADTGAADSRITKPQTGAGTLRLADGHYGSYGRAQQSFGWSQQAVDEFLEYLGVTIVLGDPIDPTLLGIPDVATVCSSYPDYCMGVGTPTYIPTPASTRFSVVRTGIGDMDLLAAKDFRMDTLYGVYTAGVSSAATSASDPYNLPRVGNSNGTVLNDASGAYEKFVNGGPNSLARAWYPTEGGNLTVRVGGSISGNQMAAADSGYQRPNPDDTGYDTAAVGNWLWRQGSGSTLGGGNDQLTAWWINFGSYVSATADKLIGFTGLGALGGGNLRVEAGGDAGTLGRTVGLQRESTFNWRSQSLVLAVGSTGRVGADGSLTLTGGGDLDVRIGGALNPVSATNDVDPSGGALVNLRGSVQVQAAELGRMTMSYSAEASRSIPGETRAFNAFVPTRADLGGGLILVPGDATFNLSSRGDQVINSAIDPGRVSQMRATPLTASMPDPNDPIKSLPTGSGTSWFSLWTKNTALNLFSAGGNLSPIMPGTGSDLSIVYPGSLSAVAASGSLYYGLAGTTSNNNLVLTPLLLAPSANGQLEFLAHKSIYSGGYTVSQSAGASSSMATPFRPAFSGTTADGTVVSNLNSDGSHVNFSRNSYPLFAFGSGTASGDLSGNGQPARFYAVDGDLIGVSSGRAISFTVSRDETRSGQLWYEGAQPVWMRAGRDIVGSGSRLGNADLFQGEDKYSAVNNLFVNNSVNDVSIVSAGRDILYSGFAVAGPGTLETMAGRNIQMEDRVGVNSIGPIVAGDKRPGAGIAMQAGVSAAGADYAGLIARYLDPANLMTSGTSLASQPGKVVKTYEKELAAWLTERYGFTGNTEQARTFFAGLPAEQQRVFARQVYFAELTAGGREYNDPNSPRSASYLRGRNMIASLFPSMNAAGSSLTYAGDITMFGNAGVHTMFGGDIQMLSPGGRQVFGVEGTSPAGSTGVITQGAGNVQLYSLGSILLGQSRIMTTFGGNVIAWSANGDINAGRGSKTTVVYTPPKRVYDRWGNVTLSADVPSSGAGIATLAPIPEVPAGDVDLIAPLGTIDAGEAGIRVSGNVNLAALQVINAANIQVKGDAVGIPTIAAVNVGALTNASAAASSAASAAQDSVQRARNEARQALPSIFTVRVLGFGNEQGSGGEQTLPRSGLHSDATGYDAKNRVQILGHGENFNPELLSRLTAEQRRQLQQPR